MLLRTSGASRLNIANAPARVTAIATTKSKAFFHSCCRHGVRRTGTQASSNAGTPTTSSMLARKVQLSRSRTSRESVCAVLASIAVSMTTP